MKRRILRIVSVLLAALLAVSAFAPALAAKLMPGDVDLDGKLTAADARLALREAVGLEKLSDDALRCADADHNNEITAADARLILRASVGLETLSPMPEAVQAVVYQSRGFPATELTFPNGEAQTVGTIANSGLRLEVQPDSLTKGTVVSATPMTREQFSEIDLGGRFERVMFPMDITCEGYDGSFFDDGVRLTMPLMEEEYGEDTPYDRFVFCYYDEAKKEIRVLFPDEIDTEAHTMTVSLPHFSPWWGAKLTESEQIEQFLDRYCMQLAVAQSEKQKAAAELEPYLNAKAEALELTANAAKDLVQCAVNYVGGGFVFEDEGSSQVGSFISMGTNYTTSMLRAYYDDDKDGAKSALSDAAGCALQQSWSELKFSERAASVFKNQAVKDFAPGTLDTLISNFGAIGTILGCISADDPEGALQAVGGVLEGVDPNVALATKAIAFVGTVLHTSFTFWKANQIEALYQVYKNGGRFLFCNEVFPRDRQSFLMFLNTSSGFTLAKGVKRFYNLDKIGEICKKYGWSFKDYKSMPQKYRDIFEKRAEDGLMTYFETRAAQEDAAAQLKEIERKSINTMLNRDLGALRRTNFRSFFHEKPGGYDVTARLERLIRVKRFIAQYVDEDRLNADKLNNWGDMLNSWIYFASNYQKTEALEKFIGELKRDKLLRNGMDVEYKRSAARQFFGTYVGYGDWYESRSFNPGDGSDHYRVKYTLVIGLDLKGRLSIRETREKIEKNGYPYTDKNPRTEGARLDADEYQIRDGALYVPSKDHVGGYAFKISGGGSSVTSTHTYWYWDVERDEAVEYEASVQLYSVSEN